MPRIKFLQFEKKISEEGDADLTWQLIIIKNRSLLTVMFETPSRIIHSNGGLHILLLLLTCTSLLGADFQHDRFLLGFYLFCEYMEPYNQ